MSKVTIVTDSTAGIPQHIVDHLNIVVVPLFVIWEGEEYRDGVDITSEEFYNRLETAKELPTSSQPLPATFKKIFSDEIEAGNDVLAVLVSHKLSGTFASAEEAVSEFDQGRIKLFDTLSVSMGTGIQAIAAARKAQAGGTLEECYQAAVDSQRNCQFPFVVKTLKYLKMGGRIGGAAHLLGTALNLKPILKIEDGAVASVEKVRTRKKSIQMLINMVIEEVKDKEEVRAVVLHANDLKTAEEVKDQLGNSIELEECITAIFSPAIGVHSGPGAIGIAYTYK